jgi:hypothetical protein
MKIICVDIDETICNYDGVDREYPNATPIKENIEKINTLFDKGHTIIYWTARGSTTGLDWSELTIQQLQEWGAKYNEIKFGKPYYDLFIDDKAINTLTFFKGKKYEFRIS